MTRATIEHQTRFLTIGGKDIQMNVGGSGPPLLYLHSAGGETEWAPFHDRLAERFTVHLPAHPGFARSEGLDRIDTIADLAWHYVDLIDELGWEQVPIVGYSLGAWIGVELAILRPALVPKMVMVAAAGLHVAEAPMAELFIDDLEALRELCFYDPNDPMVDVALPTSLDDPRMLFWIRAREATARVGWNPYLHNPKLPDHLHRVRCPVKLIWGREDRLIPPAHGEVYTKLLPDASLIVLDRCGHMVPYERTDKFVAETTAFLRD